MAIKRKPKNRNNHKICQQRKHFTKLTKLPLDNFEKEN